MWSYMQSLRLPRADPAYVHMFLTANLGHHMIADAHELLHGPFQETVLDFMFHRGYEQYVLIQMLRTNREPLF